MNFYRITIVVTTLVSYKKQEALDSKPQMINSNHFVIILFYINTIFTSSVFSFQKSLQPIMPRPVRRPRRSSHCNGRFSPTR